jgi:hypothetical protein
VLSLDPPIRVVQLVVVEESADMTQGYDAAVHTTEPHSADRQLDPVPSPHPGLSRGGIPVTASNPSAVPHFLTR